MTDKETSAITVKKLIIKLREYPSNMKVYSLGQGGYVGKVTYNSIEADRDPAMDEKNDVLFITGDY